MSDALPLPPTPNVKQYEKLALDFHDACKSSESGAIREWAALWTEELARLRGGAIAADIRERVERSWDQLRQRNERAAACTLDGAQFFVARAHGFASWAEFVEHINALAR